MAEFQRALMNNYQVYPREFFSGVDVYIAFENVPIDQIVTMQFTLQEPIIPIYGYASYTYDAVAHGARLVNGSFAINFKEAFYIKSALTKMSLGGQNTATPKSVKKLTKDELVSWVKGKDITDIEKIADSYETMLWGDEKSPTINKYQTPFFINRTAATEPSVENPLSAYGFDIILCYGNELFELGKAVDEFPSTVKVINGVHITGVNQVVRPTGEAIYEEYTFIAKDLDNTLVKLKK